MSSQSSSSPSPDDTKRLEINESKNVEEMELNLLNEGKQVLSESTLEANKEFTPKSALSWRDGQLTPHSNRTSILNTPNGSSKTGSQLNNLKSSFFEPLSFHKENEDVDEMSIFKLEKIYKMACIGSDKLKEINLVKDCRLFEDVFDNSDVANFDNEEIPVETEDTNDNKPGKLGRNQRASSITLLRNLEKI